MKQPQDTTTIWYAAETGNHQGLIICEETGNTIAVAYDKANAPLLALAPQLQDSHRELLEALESATKEMQLMGHIIRSLDEAGDYNESWTHDGEYMLLESWKQAGAAIAKARGLDT